MSDPDIENLIAAANWLRGVTPPLNLRAASRSVAAANGAEVRLTDTYRPTTRLAVYGSLAPGKVNHHLLAKLGGVWTRGRVRGDLVNAGWGATGGFPGLVPNPASGWVAVDVLESPKLIGAWRELDSFEGSEYQRVLIAVYAEDDESRVETVANLYALAR